MTDIADNVIATLTAVQELTTQIQALATAVAAIQAPATPVVDFTPVLAAISALGAQLEPTPAASPAPSPAPAA